MALYNNITDARLAAGKGWLPALSLQLLGNDWALATCPFDTQFPLDSMSTGITIYQNLAQFNVRFPADWTYDDTYSEGLELRLVIELEHRSQDGNQSYNLRIADTVASNTSNVVTSSSTSFAWNEMTVTYDNTTTWPTGSETYFIQGQFTSSSPSSTMEYRRLFGDRGPTCRYEVVLT